MSLMKRNLINTEWSVLEYFSEEFSNHFIAYIISVHNFQPKEKGLLSKYDELEGETKKTFRLGVFLNELKNLLFAALCYICCRF